MQKTVYHCELEPTSMFEQLERLEIAVKALSNYSELDMTIVNKDPVYSSLSSNLTRNFDETRDYFNKLFYSSNADKLDIK